MYERHMLVANTLDIVFAVAIAEQCRAFKGFNHANFGTQRVLEVVTRGDGAG